jgi:hypothetical protein
MIKEARELATSTAEIKQVKIGKDLLKKAHVMYAKVKEDILTQEGIVQEALQFFIDQYPKVAESTKKRSA